VCVCVCVCMCACVCMCMYVCMYIFIFATCIYIYTYMFIHVCISIYVLFSYLITENRIQFLLQIMPYFPLSSSQLFNFRDIRIWSYDFSKTFLAESSLETRRIFRHTRQVLYWFTYCKSCILRIVSKVRLVREIGTKSAYDFFFNLRTCNMC